MERNYQAEISTLAAEIHHRDAAIVALRAELAAANTRADGLEAFARKVIARCANPETTKFYNDVTYLIVDTFGAVDMTKAALDGGEG